MKPKVLEQRDLTVFQRIYFLLGRFANTIFGKRYRLRNQLRQMFRDRTQAVLIHALAFRPAQMRRQNHSRAVFGGVVNGGNRGANAGVVVDFAVFDGDVEIYADEDALAFEIKILDGELGHCRFSIADCQLDCCLTPTWARHEPSLTVGLLPRHGRRPS